jgi:uridine kinase
MGKEENSKELLQQYERYTKMQINDLLKPIYKYYSEIFQKIDSLMESNDRILIAIDGNCGAGKSTLAALIGEVYDCNIFHMDHFFLPPILRTKERLEEIGGNVDYTRFREQVIGGIHSDQEFRYQIYDCKKATMDKSVTVQPKKLNIIEGTYSMHPTLIESYELKVFLHLDEREQRGRILERNGEVVLKQFLSKWIPLENIYFKQLRIEEQSDLVFKNNNLFVDNML